MSLLAVEELTVAYPQAAQPAVAGLSFAVAAGDALGVVGESGSGKTQTALAIMGLLPANARVTGSVRFDGCELLGRDTRLLNRFRARRLAMVFQDPAAALNPCLTIGGQLQRVLRAHRIVRRNRAKRAALELLERVHLPDPERQLGAYPHQLSGGMRQRAMIALALAAEPEIVIADEPTTALDVTVQSGILALLRELRERSGAALVLVTHDLGVIAQNSERMLVMHRGRLLEEGRTEAVFRDPAHPHTRSLLDAAPRLDARAPPEPPAAAPLVEITHVTAGYAERRPRLRRRVRPAVRDVSLAVAPGETLAIVGESGSGKTTLARAIVGLVAPQDGRIAVSGEPLARELAKRAPAERRRVQMVFQDPLGSLDPAMTVRDTLAEGVRLSRACAGDPGLGPAIRELLHRVRLDDSLLDRKPHELSGGQAQRVAIARALAVDPRVLVCDEAVAALDGKVREQVLEVLRAEQQASGLSLIFITHDLAIVRGIAHRVAVMYAGRICELAGNRSLFERPRHPYTRALMDAVPVPDPTVPPPASRHVAAPGSGRGCAWQPYCGHAIARCGEERPSLQPAGNGVAACHRADDIDLRQ